MWNFLARTFSVIFHPLIMPVIGIIFLLYSGSYLSLIQFEGKLFIISVVFISTFFLPLSLIPMLLYWRLVKNIQMEDKKERFAPMIITAIFYYFCFYVLRTQGMPYQITLYILSSLIALTLTLIINWFWKISAHMIGIGGLTGLILALSIKLTVSIETILICVVIIAGIIGSSRLKLNQHNPAQIYAGYALGLITVFLVNIFL